MKIAGAIILASFFCAVAPGSPASCFPGHAFYAVKSDYDNNSKDRDLQFSCKNLNAALYPCHWTNYVNDLEQPVIFQCPANYVAAGEDSYFSSYAGDRMWRFRCCRADGYHTRNCALTDYINDWNGVMNYQAPNGKFLVGFHSYHDNSKE